MDIEKLIQEGYKKPNDELEDYFRKLYEEFNGNRRIIYEYANVLDYLGKEKEDTNIYGSLKERSVRKILMICVS